jgi:septal ring-binding cell division protein DamX
MLSGGLGLLALIGVVLLIIALASGSDKGASPTPTPSAAAPLATTTPGPTTTATPFGTTTPTPSPSPSPSPGVTVTPSPSASATTTAVPTTTPGASPTTGTTGSFPGWTGGNGWTIIIESATTQAKAQSVASAAQAAGETVGILKSDDFSSLNAGYWVVFTGHYATKSEAQSNLAAARAKHPDAYVRHIVQ